MLYDINGNSILEDDVQTLITDKLVNNIEYNPSGSYLREIKDAYHQAKAISVYKDNTALGTINVGYFGFVSADTIISTYEEANSIKTYNTSIDIGFDKPTPFYSLDELKEFNPSLYTPINFLPWRLAISEEIFGLRGKTWVQMGDSITAKSGGMQRFQNGANSDGFLTRIASKYGMVVRNEGTSGASWTKTGSACSKVKALVDSGCIPDYVTLAYGTNMKNETDVGTMDDEAGYEITVCGSIKWCIEQLRTLSSTIHLGIILPTKRYDGIVTNKELQERCELIKSIASLYSVPTLDMFNESGICNIGNYYIDGLHFSDIGVEMYTRQLDAFIKRI